MWGLAGAEGVFHGNLCHGDWIANLNGEEQERSRHERMRCDGPVAMEAGNCLGEMTLDVGLLREKDADRNLGDIWMMSLGSVRWGVRCYFARKVEDEAGMAGGVVESGKADAEAEEGSDQTDP